MLPITLSTFHAHAAIARDPALASDRARQDVLDRKKIKDALDDSGKRYGARKIWHELRRNNHDIARCTVERLMKAMGIKGVVRGQKPITTNPDRSRPCPDDKVRACRVKLNSPDRLNALCFANAASTCLVNTSIRSNPTRFDREFPAAMPNQLWVSFKTEVIDFMGPWKSVGQVEWETLKWVNRYNTKRLHSKIGYITPQEADQKHYQTWNAAEKAA